MTDPNHYSINRCTVAQMLEILSIWCGCVPVYDTMQPNDTNVCTPHHIYACYHGSFQGGVKIPVRDEKQKNSVKTKDVVRQAT